jgi:hypothetical protein
MYSNYTEWVQSLPPPVQSALGGAIFMSIFSFMSIILLGDMYDSINRMKRILRQEDRYVY